MRDYKVLDNSDYPTVTATPIVTPLPDAIKVSSLIINPRSVKPNDHVNICLRITNTGDVTVNDMVVLKINNLIVASQDVIPAGGVSKIVTFTTSDQLPGDKQSQLPDSMLILPFRKTSFLQVMAGHHWGICAGCSHGIVFHTDDG